MNNELVIENLKFTQSRNLREESWSLTSKASQYYLAMGVFIKEKLYLVDGSTDFVFYLIDGSSDFFLSVK